ncbi:recombinase RecF [Methanobrevibacter sp. YE315]|uniref:AAA family ATPase n=1 Tax=Methanobrevibacter sp. YE315 TaxID=1609968 RepID=UPI000764DC35|nr:SMC family ATPase [Methanobrevibacter sp. YE315]AMD17546.1 recombinase RecF [Methanobrevibacter sp. YE315]
MIFTKLKLINFKSHENTIIKFDKGISVIVGENGAGKSTILEGISFALFKQHTGKKIDDLVRNNAQSMLVELGFTSNGRQYKIIREKKSNLTSSIYKKTSADGDYVHICSGDKEVANEIRQILDIDSDLFLNAIYIRQGEISELVDKTPAEKKKLIGKLLGIDSLEKAWNNLLPLITDYENELSELKGKLYNSDELKENLEKKKDELNSLKERGHELEKNIEEVNELRDEISESKRNMEREKEIYEAQSNNLISEEKTLSKLENDKRTVQDDLDKINNAEEEIERLEKYVSKLDTYLDFEKSVTSIQNLKEKEKEINEKIDSINRQKEIIADNKENYNKFLVSDEEISKLDEQKLSLEKELATMAKLEKDKKDFLKQIEDERNDIDNFFSRAKEKLHDNGLDQDIVAGIDNFTQIENATNDFLDETSTKIKDLGKDIISKNEDIVVFKQNIKACERPLEELGEIDNKCPVCQSDIDENKKKELVDQYSNDIETNKRLISENEEAVRLLTKNKESFEEKYDILLDLSKNIIEYKQKFNHLQSEIYKLNEIDEKLESKEYISNKLGEIILLIANKKSERESCQESYDLYNQAQGALEVLGSVTELQYQLNQINNEIDNHVSSIKWVIEQDPHLSGDISEEELQDRINDLKQKNEEFNQLKGFVKNKQSYLTQLDSIKEDIGMSINQIDIIKNKINASVYDEEKYEQIIYRSDMYERRYNTFNNELSEIKGRARETIVYVKDLTEKIEKADKFQQEYNDVSDYINLLNHIRSLYSKNGIQKDLRNISRPLIQKYTKEFFNEFNFNYSDLTLDEEYDVTVYGPEGKSSMSMVSGGEKIAIALALRLGITQAMSNGELDTILLDEPTIHLDNSRKHELINLLKEMSLLPQMIIVTHEAQLENAADNLIKVEKVNGISNVIV